MLPFYCVRISTRNSWRSRRDTKSGATVQSIAAINEVALRFIFSTLIHHFFREKEELEERCKNTSQCLEECSSKYEELMRAYCRDVLVSRDHRVAEYVRCNGSDGLRALQLARIPGFPLLEMQEAVLGAAELDEQLEATRPARQAALFHRVLSYVQTNKTLLERVEPNDFALDGLAHVITYADAVALRQGKVLVLDPSPALLPFEQMKEAMQDFLAFVKGGYGMVNCAQGLRTNPRQH